MVKIFADGASLEQIVRLNGDARIAGFTTNPSLMRAAGVTDYAAFAQEVLRVVKKPVSFEVIADEWDEMERQARLIASWGENVYVKIPITNTRGESACPLISRLSKAGIRVNVTAVFTVDQVLKAAFVLQDTPAVLSVFAGRIADAGVDPCHVVRRAGFVCGNNVEILWASAREVYNVTQAAQCGCDIITLSPELYAKLALYGKNLTDYSLDTVKMFYRDAKAAGYSL